MTTNRSQFEISITTDPDDFGYGHNAASSDRELLDRIGVDKRGTIMTVSAYLAEQLKDLGGTYSRTVIREIATDRFWTRSEFSEEASYRLASRQGMVCR